MFLRALLICALFLTGVAATTNLPPPALSNVTIDVGAGTYDCTLLYVAALGSQESGEQLEPATLSAVRGNGPKGCSLAATGPKGLPFILLASSPAGPLALADGTTPVLIKGTFGTDVSVKLNGKIALTYATISGTFPIPPHDPKLTCDQFHAQFAPTSASSLNPLLKSSITASGASCAFTLDVVPGPFGFALMVGPTVYFVATGTLNPNTALTVRPAAGRTMPQL